MERAQEQRQPRQEREGTLARPARPELVALASAVGNAAFTRLARAAVPPAERVTPGDGGTRPPRPPRPPRRPSRRPPRQPPPHPEPEPAQEHYPRPRTNLAFIMGRDRPGSPNPYYTVARRYAEQLSWVAQIVDAPRYRSLAGIFRYLRERPGMRVGNLYIVTHANADGDMLFPLDEHDRDRRLTYPELRRELRRNPRRWRLTGQIDAGTTIRIKGCNLGRAAEMVELIDEVFGGEEQVIAPLHYQVYGGPEGEVVEGYTGMYISYPGAVTPPAAEVVARFRERYADVFNWDRILEVATPEQLIGPPNSRYLIWREVRVLRGDQRDRTGRPDAYDWSVPGADGRTVGAMTEYTLHAPDRPEDHSRELPFPLPDEIADDDPRYFYASRYAPPRR